MGCGAGTTGTACTQGAPVAADPGTTGTAVAIGTAVALGISGALVAGTGVAATTGPAPGTGITVAIGIGAGPAGAAKPATGTVATTGTAVGAAAGRTGLACGAAAAGDTGTAFASGTRGVALAGADGGFAVRLAAPIFFLPCFFASICAGDDRGQTARARSSGSAGAPPARCSSALSTAPRNWTCVFTTDTGGGPRSSAAATIRRAKDISHAWPTARK
eukprot:scaffold8943_cov103-Isochrysis_galbana.AAC.1